MKKTNPMMLWVIMWVLGVLFITFRNRLAAGAEVNIGSIIFLNVILDIIVIPVSIAGFYLMKFIAKAAGASDFVEGKNGLRNVLIVWLVIFLMTFLFPLFRG